MRWRLLLTPPLSGPANMALDEALMARARATGETVLRVYAWSEPTLSLGRNQRGRAVYSAERCQALGVKIVRRITGGRAVLHHREITYSVTAPVSEDSSLADSYGRFNLLLLDALARLGVDAQLAKPTERMRAPGSAPCFETPAPGEIELDGRKLAGSAQVREDGALLQHGSILIDDDQGMVAQLASIPVGDVPPTATLREALHRAPSLEEVATHLFASARQLMDPDAQALELDSALRAEAEHAEARFCDPGWTWRL